MYAYALSHSSLAISSSTAHAAASDNEAQTRILLKRVKIQNQPYMYPVKGKKNTRRL